MRGTSQSKRVRWGSRPQTITLALIVTGLAAAVMIIGACGTPSNPTDSVSTTTTTSPSSMIPHPIGPDQVVFKVSTGGGLVPAEYNVTATPEFVLYGDGRVIVPGPVIAIYPGPALPNLQTAFLPEEAVQSILVAAREAGLFQTGVDYGQPGITDVGTTSFLIDAAGQTYQTHIYALGMETAAGGLTLEQQQARAAVQDFRNKLIDLTAFTTEQLQWAPFVYDRLAVYSRPAAPSGGSDSTDVAPNYLDWPLRDLGTTGEALPTGFRRQVVTGSDLAALQDEALLGQATQITLWRSAGKTYHLYFRPLLPDEKD